MRNAADILWLGFRRRLTVVAGMAIILAALLSLIYTVVIYASGLRPIIEGQVLALAEVAAGTIEYALESGVPWDRLNGVDSYLSSIVAQNGELASLRLETGPLAETSSAAAQSSGMMASVIDFGVLFSLLFGNSLDPIHVPVSLDGQVLGQLVAVTDTGVIVERLQNVFFDTLVILFVSILVANEVVIVFVSNKVQQPLERLSGALFKRASGDLGTYGATLGLGGRISALIGQLNVLNASLWDRARRALEQGSRTLTSTIQISNLADRQGVRRASVLDARIPLFIFCFAEELQKSFLPLFVADMWQPTDWFDRSLMLGMPISLFMFVIAALTPFSGALVERFGTRRMFLYGLVPAVGGYLLCAFAGSANDILLGRGLTAVGYAIITIASQSYIADVATRDNRAKSMAVFVGVLMTATLCGTAVGAVLADWVGFKVVFLISTVLAAAAGVLALITLFPKEAMQDDEEAPVGAKAKGSLGSFFRILLNARFALLVIFCAIPAKVVLTGILYLLVPLYLAELASSQSEIGRIMMLYSLIIIPISPLASRLADRFDRNLAFVVGATLASGLLLVALIGNTSVLGVLVMVAGLGLVHAFLKAPLIVSVVEVADEDSRISRTAAMSLLRTSERIGSVVGPVLVGGLLTVLTFPQTIATIGAIVLGFGVLMVVILLLKQLMSRPQVSA